MTRDVFGLDGDGERTVIRRTGAGGDDRTVMRPVSPTPAAGPDDAGDRTVMQPRRPMLEPGPVPIAGLQPPERSQAQFHGRYALATAAAPLLVIASGLLRIQPSTDLKALRQAIVRELDLFRVAARRLDQSDAAIATADYALCATLDDLVLSSPVGGDSFWRKPSLVATYHNEVVSGDRMFDIAEDLLRAARPDSLPLIELIYLCFSLGFEGRLRIDPRGGTAHQQVRERLYNGLRTLAGAGAPELSPQWQGAGAAQVPLRRAVPWWVWWAGCAALGLLIYAGLLFNQALRLDGLLARLTGLTSVPAQPYQRPVVVQPSSEADRVRALLAPDVAAGRLVIVDEGDTLIIRLASTGLFASGSADIAPDFLPTLERVAQAIAAIRGSGAIEGHTDSVPIRSLRFPSNAALSLARAQGVADFMRGRVPGAMLAVTGLGADAPIASNADADGRAANRRVDVRLRKTAGWERVLEAAGPGATAAPVLPDLGDRP